MTVVLLIVIYIAFIGLGLPDSLFGAAWPAIQASFSLPLDMANYITMTVSGCTVLSSLFSDRIVKKLGTPIVVAASTALTAIGLLCFSFSGNIFFMCLCAIPLGIGAGAIDAALNNYIALHYSAMHMNFLHCFYGVGVMTSPYVMSVLLGRSGWQQGYRSVFLIQATIAAIMILSFPLWKKVKHKAKEEAEPEVETKILPYSQMVKMPAVRRDWLMCIAINALEGVGGVWGSGYLVYALGLSASKAAGAITMFYIGMALGRFLSGLLSTKISSWRIIGISTVVMAGGIALLFVPVPAVAIAGLFFLGFGNGPIYPNIMHLTPKHFGEEVSASVMGSQMAAAYFGIMIGPPIFGLLAENVSASLYPVYLTAWTVVFVVATALFLKKQKENRT